MNVLYQKKFLKDLANIPSKRRVHIERFVFEDIHTLTTIFETGKVESMTGYSGFYKIRFGNYRVGLKIVNDVVSFERVLHRREIYRYFP